MVDVPANSIARYSASWSRCRPAMPFSCCWGQGCAGALTTYSTFSCETLVLARSGARTMALLNVGASVLAGFGAAYCGTALAQAIQ